MASIIATRGLNYAYHYRTFEGIKAPTTRRVAGFDDGKLKIPFPVLVAIERARVSVAGDRSRS